MMTDEEIGFLEMQEQRISEERREQENHFKQNEQRLVRIMKLARAGLIESPKGFFKHCPQCSSLLKRHYKESGGGWLKHWSCPKCSFEYVEAEYLGD